MLCKKRKKKESKRTHFIFLAAGFVILGCFMSTMLDSHKQAASLIENSASAPASVPESEPITDNEKEAGPPEESSSASSRPADDFLYQGETLDATNIRISAGLDQDVVFVAPKGTLLDILDDAGEGWVRIRALDGRTGWCDKQLLKIEQTAAEESGSPAEEPIAFPAFAQVTSADAALPFTIHVSIKEQRVVVVDAKKLVVQSFPCSTGKEGYETPTGNYSITNRGESFYNQKLKEGAYYWTQFYGDYLFHSVPFDESRKINQAEADKLGAPASHGCVRLSIDDAKWIYDNIKKDTKVIIQ